MNYDDALAAFQRASGWRTSSFTHQGANCVEVAEAAVAGWVGVRDSKLGAVSPILAFTVAEWRSLITAAKSGTFDVSPTR